MRDGTLEGMQVFDGELERMMRNGIITMNDGLAYATNRQNLLLQLSDLGGGAIDELMGMDSRTGNLGLGVSNLQRPARSFHNSSQLDVRLTRLESRSGLLLCLSRSNPAGGRS